MVEVKVNGEEQTLEQAYTLDSLLEKMDQNKDGVAVAINDEVVPKSEWPNTQINQGDKIEILGAVQGG